MPERSLRNVDLELDAQVVPVPAEQRVIAHRDGDVQIARRAAIRARFALTADTDLRALIHPGRDADLQRAHAAHLAPAPALRAQMRDGLPGAVAGRAGGDVDHLAEERLADAAHLARAATGGAALRRRTRRGARAGARRAGGGLLKFDLLLGAKHRFGEVNRQPVLEIRPTAGDLPRGLARRAECTAEELVEDVGHAAEPGERVRGCRRVNTGMAKAVVGSAFLRVAQNLVGLVDLLELLLRPLFLVNIRVVLARLGPECPLDLLARGVPADAEHFIVITFSCHTPLIPLSVCVMYQLFANSKSYYSEPCQMLNPASEPGKARS